MTGLFLGRCSPGLLNGRQVAAASRQRHDAFRNTFGAACCRVLMKHLRAADRPSITVNVLKRAP